MLIAGLGYLGTHGGDTMSKNFSNSDGSETSVPGYYSIVLT